MENENGKANPQEPEVVVPETTPEETGETTETLEEVKAKLAKAEKIAENQRIRAEKAEKAAKEPKAPVETESNMSPKDYLALSRANVHEDDIDVVSDWAKFKKIPLMEALKDPVMQTTLKDREEQRKAASASNTGNARRSSVKVSDEDVVAKVAAGELPEDPAALARARWNLKKKK